MKSRNRPSFEERREAMFERLRYFVSKARRNPKSLTLAEIDELCEVVVLLAPQKETK